MFLEKQMQKVDGVLSGFEEQLAKDGVILDKPDALQQRSQQLQVLYFGMNFQDRLIWMPQNLKPKNYFLCSFSWCQTKEYVQGRRLNEGWDK